MKHYIYILVACLLWATPVLGQDSLKVLYKEVKALKEELAKAKREGDSAKNTLNSEIKELKIEKGFFSTILGLQGTAYSIIFGALIALFGYLSWNRFNAEVKGLKIEYDSKNNSIKEDVKGLKTEYNSKTDNLKTDYQNKIDNLKQYFDTQSEVQKVRNGEILENSKKLTEDLEHKYDEKVKEIRDEYKNFLAKIQDDFDKQILTNTHIFASLYDLMANFLLEQGKEAKNILAKTLFFLKSAYFFNEKSRLDIPIPDNDFFTLKPLLEDIKKIMQGIEAETLIIGTMIFNFANNESRELYINTLAPFLQSSNEDIKYYSMRLKRLIEEKGVVVPA